MWMSCGQPMAARAGGAALRRRARQLRSFLRHERMTVRMALAEALRHSCGVEPSGPNVALRGQTTARAAVKRPEPLGEVSNPHVGAVTVGHVAAPRPLLSTQLLADTAAETVDARTVKYLLQKTLAQKKEEERRRGGKRWRSSRKRSTRRR